MKKLIPLLILLAPLFCHGQSKAAQPARIDTTVRVSLPVLQSFINTAYSIAQTDAQRIRLNMALNDLQKRATLTVDSLKNEGKKL